MNEYLIRRSFLLLLLCANILIFIGCAGGGIDPKEDPVQTDGDTESANPAANNAENNVGLNAENSNEGNNAENPNQANNNLGNNGGNEGAAINNAEDENFLNNDANSNANMFGNNQTAGPNANNKNNNNKGANNNFGLANDGALENGNIGDILESPVANVDAAATDNSLLEPTPSADSVLAPDNQNSVAPSGGVVRYVTSGGSKLYDKPDGTIQHDLEQGDHPLVNEQGEWSRTSDGYYVPAATLTASPIPRLKQSKEWN